MYRYTIWNNSVIVRVSMIMGCIGHFTYALLGKTLFISYAAEYKLMVWL
jgi:hypothetical protein